jgi:flagellar biosynthesis GTPase FlhF
MSRQRLSWDAEKVAEIRKTADPYTMNQERHNPPASKYDVGDSYAFGEEPDMKHRWEAEGRTEDGHPAPQPAAREAVVQAKKLEDKALKCLTIAQRMLPGAEDISVEDQATDLMFLPERAILATLQRQSDVATKIAGEKKKEDEEEEVEAAKKCDDEKKEEEVEAAKKEDKKEEEEVEAAKKEEPKKDETTPPAEVKKAVEEKKEEKKEETKKEEVEAAKKEEPKKEEEEVEAAKKEEPKKEEEKVVEEKEASDKDLLDILFDQVPEPKVGAKKLSGLVKQASSGDPLDNLWDAPPDVSAAFR